MTLFGSISGAERGRQLTTTESEPAALKLLEMQYPFLLTLNEAMVFDRPRNLRGDMHSGAAIVGLEEPELEDVFLADDKISSRARRLR